MFTIKEIISATNGRCLQGQEDLRVSDVTTDSRQAKRGTLFIAVKGERFDGHDFIKDVVAKGVRVVVVDQNISISAQVTVIKVKNTVKALGYLAQFHRNRFNIPVIAVTGSAGKTTTKEMIANVLGTQLNVLKNLKTENNHFGVPYTLFQLNKNHQVAVIEVGTNQPGDIHWLAEILKPTLAVFTNIGESHLERLKNKQGVFKEKTSLIEYMPANGTLIFNNDDSYLKKIMVLKSKQKKVNVGLSLDNAFQAKNILNLSGKLSFTINGQKYSLNCVGTHNIYNALLAIACAKECKVKKQNIVKGLKDFKFPSGRQQIKHIKNRLIIDDSYNANPVSVRAAIDLLSNLNISGKRIMVCGDMLELGKETKELHRAIGKLVAQSRIDVFMTFGNLAKEMAVGAKASKNNLNIYQAKTLEDVTGTIHEILKPGDALLIKGSRGMKMERVVEFLEKGLT
jgi:UDP-N-acetylmuramoyl-tripeptide--D-alanyl-D-alanine ligase